MSILFVCFVALRPKSAAMAMEGPNHTFFLGKLEQAVTCNQYFVHILSLVTDKIFPEWIIVGCPFKVTTHSNNRNSKSSREVILGSVRLWQMVILRNYDMFSADSNARYTARW